MAQQNHHSQQKPSFPSKPGAPRPGAPRPNSSFSKPANSSNFKKPVQQQNGKQYASGRVPMVFVNESIKAPTIVIIDEEGTNLGTFQRRRAFEIAEEQGKDLVQMRYDQETMTSTVKLLDYGRYMYLKQKEDREKKKNQKPNVMKELKLNYAIGENDLALKMKKAKEMLQDGYNVKFLIKLKGREKIYADKAVEKLQAVKQALSDVGRPQFEHPKQEVHGYSMVLFNK